MRKKVESVCCLQFYASCRQASVSCWGQSFSFFVVEKLIYNIRFFYIWHPTLSTEAELPIVPCVLLENKYQFCIGLQKWIRKSSSTRTRAAKDSQTQISVACPNVSNSFEIVASKKTQRQPHTTSTSRTHFFHFYFPFSVTFCGFVTLWLCHIKHNFSIYFL